jgi:hypothetical protein
MGTQTRGAAVHTVAALTGMLIFSGAVMLASEPARAGATTVPAFQLKGLSWNCDGTPAGGAPAGSAVIGITGDAKNPIVHGTAQMRGLASNTTYELRLYQSSGNQCSMMSLPR